MSLSVNAGDIINVRTVCLMPSQGQSINVLHYRIAVLSGPPPAINDFLVAVASAAVTAFSARYAACMAADCSFVSAGATSVSPVPRSLTLYSVLTTPLPGVITGQSIPAQNAFTIVKHTNRGDKHGIGRCFISGIAESDSQNGVIGTTTVAAAALLATALQSNLTAVGTGWSAILNPVLIQGPESAPITVTNITSMQLSNTTIKSRKTRRPGKGI